MQPNPMKSQYPARGALVATVRRDIISEAFLPHLVPNALIASIMRRVSFHGM